MRWHTDAGAWTDYKLMKERHVNSPRVLIVDDHDAFIEMAAFILRAAAFVVESAADAREMFLQVGSFRPDLILMDIEMPIADGLELTRRLKAVPATRHIVIVAFTSFAIEGDEAKLRAAGFDGYIAKPIDVVTFAAEVRSKLGPASAWGERPEWP